MTTLPTGLTGLDAFPPVTIIPSSKSTASDTNSEQNGRGGEGRGAQGSSSLPPKPRTTRYESLDMLRGVACLMLLLYHSTFYADLTFRLGQPESWSLAGLPLSIVRKMWIGVPIFFVISGYCIAASIDSLRRRPHSLWDYFVRRFRRIYPPLWVMCGITIVFSLSMSFIPIVAENCKQLPNVAEFTLGNWLGNFAAAEAWRPTVMGAESNYLMPNTWTLCYEEQFYLVTGILLAFTAKRFFAATACVTAGVIILRHLLRSLGVNQEGFFWDGHWTMFSTGILVYHSLNYQTTRQRSVTLALLAMGIVYGAADRLLSADPGQKHLGEYIAVACLFAGALIVMRRWDKRIASHWFAVPFTWCGQRSYSIYLTHYPLVVVVSSILALGGLSSELAVATVVVPVCILLSLPVACLFYWTVEKRFLNAPATK